MFCGLGHSCLGLSVALGAYSPLATPCPRPWRADVSTNGIRVAFLCYGYFMLVGKQTASVSRIRELRHATVNTVRQRFLAIPVPTKWARLNAPRSGTNFYTHSITLHGTDIQTHKITKKHAGTKTNPKTSKLA